MSEFDKEKEREKLREQLAGEEERRQETQEMSELLLNGATMLNVHCDQCASPIFRHEGEEFCPSCGRTIEEMEADQGEPEPSEEREPDDSARTTASPDEQSTTQEPPTREPVQVPETNAGEALEAAISRLADRAATAEDPRQAAELLDAAHTAAETLAIVEGRRQSGS